ncbi:hypothetical protein [Methylomonas fluvii]|uniref:SH3 domain-containing protein n=1 Tax=Methylomonas fluvii TaxID=1854564 RepID=A0ABR9DBX9_9GAMM|nr:hypothetical protein [Methylomonas fluvii]MBD9360266.1 hypothetical protein [Methylomonas fluvii]
MRMILIICFLVIPNICKAIVPIKNQDNEVLNETYIAKSGYIYLADALKKEIQPAGLAYIPAGTRFLAHNKILNYEGRSWRLILTENGLYGYIIDSSDNYWKPSVIDIFIKNQLVSIVKMSYNIKIPLSKSEVNVTLTPSEIYQIVRESEEGVVILIGQDKLPEIKDANFHITVPKEVVSVYRKDNFLKHESINKFVDKKVEGAPALFKECGREQITTSKSGGNFGISVEKFFSAINMGVNAEIEKNEILSFEKDVSVARWYYERTDKMGYYALTKKTDCVSQKSVYSIMYSGGEELKFNEEVLDKKLSLVATGQVLLTCLDNYFVLSRILKDRGFSEEEIPFIISRVSKIQSPAGQCNKDNQKPQNTMI